MRLYLPHMPEGMSHTYKIVAERVHSAGEFVLDLTAGITYHDGITGKHLKADYARALGGGGMVSLSVGELNIPGMIGGIALMSGPVHDFVQSGHIHRHQQEAPPHQNHGTIHTHHGSFQVNHTTSPTNTHEID